MSLCIAAAAIWLACADVPACAAPPEAGPNDPERSADKLMTPEVNRAVERGLAFLAARQQDDGSFGSACPNIAVCSLAGMAMISSGSTPGRGPYGSQVERFIDYLLANTQDSGFIVSTPSTHGPMYGHGFATMFLAECYGMTDRPQIRDKLSKAVQLIVSTQNKEGGWRYQPQRADADISVTITQIMALRAARNAGLHVPRDTIDRCTQYVKRSQNPDGGFMYMLSEGGDSQFPRSAAGVVALYSAGIYEGPEIRKGLTYLMQFVPRAGRFNREGHYFYGHYYAVQAMWHAGGDDWEKWYAAIRNTLLARQADDGSWPDSICSEYGTSMATIILQMPNNYLPIFQR